MAGAVPCVHTGARVSCDRSPAGTGGLCCLPRGLLHPPSSKDFPKCAAAGSSALPDLKWQVRAGGAAWCGHIAELPVGGCRALGRLRRVSWCPRVPANAVRELLGCGIVWRAANNKLWSETRAGKQQWKMFAVAARLANAELCFPQGWGPLRCSEGLLEGHLPKPVPPQGPFPPRPLPL